MEAILELNSIINSVSHREMATAEVSFSKQLLLIKRGDKVFGIGPASLGLDSRAFKDGKVDRKARTVRAIFCKAAWFKGAFPTNGRAIRPKMPRLDALARPWPSVTYPSVEDSYGELLKGINETISVLSTRVGDLPNAEFFIDVLRVFNDIFENLKDSGKKRVFYILEAIHHSVRFDGVATEDVTKYTRVRGYAFPLYTEFIKGVYESAAWRYVLVGHIKTATEVKGPFVHETGSIAGSRAASKSASSEGSFLGKVGLYEEAMEVALKQLGAIVKDKVSYMLAIGVGRVIGTRPDATIPKVVSSVVEIVTDFNDIRETMRNDIVNLKAKLATAEDAIPPLTRKVGSLDSQLKASRAKVASLTDELNALKSTKDSFVKPKVFHSWLARFWGFLKSLFFVGRS